MTGDNNEIVFIDEVLAAIEVQLGVELIAVDADDIDIGRYSCGLLDRLGGMSLVKKKPRRGFAQTGVATGVIGVVAGLDITVIVPAVFERVDLARESDARVGACTIGYAVTMYIAEHPRKCPTLDDLKNGYVDAPKGTQDPWKQDYVIDCSNPLSPDVYSKGADDGAEPLRCEKKKSEEMWQQLRTIWARTGARAIRPLRGSRSPTSRGDRPSHTSYQLARGKVRLSGLLYAVSRSVKPVKTAVSFESMFLLHFSSVTHDPYLSPSQDTFCPMPDLPSPKVE